MVNLDPVIASAPSNESALLGDWEASRVPVYFDFGDNERNLWRLDPRIRTGTAYLSPVRKSFFLRVHFKGLPFDERCTEAVECAAADPLMQQAPRFRPLTGLERYAASQEEKGRGFVFSNRPPRSPALALTHSGRHHVITTSRAPASRQRQAARQRHRDSTSTSGPRRATPAPRAARAGRDRRRSGTSAKAAGRPLRTRHSAPQRQGYRTPAKPRQRIPSALSWPPMRACENLGRTSVISRGSSRST